MWLHSKFFTMKIASLLLVLLMMVGISSASSLRVRSIVESGNAPLVQATWPSKFGHPTSTQVNMYSLQEASSLRQLYYGVDATVLNGAGIAIDAEWTFQKVGFTVYRNSTPLTYIDLPRYVQPGGGGSPYAVMYNSQGIKTSTEFSSTLSNAVGSRFAIGELTVSLGESAPKQPLMGSFLGENYMVGFTIQGSYRAVGETVFTPFSILPGDAQNVSGKFYNYGAVITTPGKIVPSPETWGGQLDVTMLPREMNSIVYTIRDPSLWSYIPGGYIVEQESSVDLISWTIHHPGSMIYQGSNLWKAKGEVLPSEPRRFFRAKVRRVPFIYVP